MSNPTIPVATSSIFKDDILKGKVAFVTGESSHSLHLHACNLHIHSFHFNEKRTRLELCSNVTLLRFISVSIGGGSGICKGMAEALARHGAKVTIVSRT